MYPEIFKFWSSISTEELIVIKYAGNCGFGHIYWRNLNGKLYFLCSAIYIFPFWQFHNNFLKAMIGPIKGLIIFNIWRVDRNINFENKFKKVSTKILADAARYTLYLETLPSWILLVLVRLPITILLTRGFDFSEVNLVSSSQSSSLTVFNIESNLPWQSSSSLAK